MTLVDDFYKQMEPSIKAFLDDNIIIIDPLEAKRVYATIATSKSMHRLPPPNILEYFERLYTTKELTELIKHSYHSKSKISDKDEKIYEKWMFKNYGDVKLVKKIKRMDALAKAWEMGL